ncbi:hypothetical protein JYT74_01060 [Crocinitomix catalasitica]|nr:hypothetical protein [Crocinitomix catalasitica]
MEGATTQQVILGILYATGAIVLLIAAYLAFIKRFRRAKLEALSGTIELITSHENIFSEKTQFLLITPQQKEVKVSLLDENEALIHVLTEGDFSEGEHPFDFDPSELTEGKYYLYLESVDTNILRRIFINRRKKSNTDEVT